MMDLVHVSSGADLDDVRTLFREYAQSLNFNLCFQSFEKELAELPGDYAAPSGRLVLARVDGFAAGCVALRSLGDGACEMKRLYVRPEFRGQKIGLKLAEHLFAEAQAAGFQSMRLDTIPGAMDDAIRLYRSLGFSEIPPYTANPVPGAIFMEKASVKS